MHLAVLHTRLTHHVALALLCLTLFAEDNLELLRVELCLKLLEVSALYASDVFLTLNFVFQLLEDFSICAL